MSAHPAGRRLCRFDVEGSAPPYRRAQTQQAAPKPRWPVIGRWVFISAVPSGLLVAVTAYVSTDVAAAPLLWVIPLSLYLLTWVLVFQRRPLIPHRIMLLLQPFAVAAIVVLLFYTTWVPIFFSLGGHLLAFFIIAMACHGELARTRPAPRDLTTFYVSLSFGGMVGGLFAGLVAPYAFSWVAEYPILAVLAVLCRPFSQDIWKPFNRWLWPLVAVAMAADRQPVLARGDRDCDLSAGPWLWRRGPRR